MKSPNHYKKCRNKCRVNKTLSNRNGVKHDITLDSSVFPVEKILGMIIGDDNYMYYKVQWAPSWEKKENLLGCESLIEQFHIENENSRIAEIAECQINGEINPSESVETNFAKEDFVISIDEKENIDPKIEDPCADIVVINGYVDIDTRKVIFKEDTKDSCSKGDMKTGDTGKTSNPASKDLNYMRLTPCKVVVPKIEPDDMEYYQNENRSFGSMKNINSFENSGDASSKLLDQSNMSEPCAKIFTKSNNQKEVTIKSEFCASGRRNLNSPAFKKSFQRNPTSHACKKNLKNSSVSTNNSSNKIIETNCILPSDEKLFPCHLCNKRYQSSCSLKRHIKLHNVTAALKCNTCNCKFKSNSGLQSHKKANKCDATFLRNFISQVHLTIQSEGEVFKCNECQEVFATESGLQQHTKCHTKDKPFKCSVCDKRYQHSSDLHHHAVVHTEERPYKCNECQKSFKTKYSLQQHGAYHSEERPFMCNECDKRFKTKQQQQQHNILHTGERPYQCTKCWKSFQNSSNLLAHERVHSGERPFKCTWCCRRFKTKHALQRHSTLHEKK